MTLCIYLENGEEIKLSNEDAFAGHKICEIDNPFDLSDYLQADKVIHAVKEDKNILIAPNKIERIEY